MNHNTGLESPWCRYLRLMEERPQAFAPSPLLPIETDSQTVADFTARTGQAIGVVYESRYQIMVVDLVRGPEGLFAYERVLPAAQGDAVVAVPIWDGKFVLLEQFRHALRRCQIAFPRGFGEGKLSAEKNICKEIQEELQSEVLAQRPLGRIAPDSGLTAGEACAILCDITEPKPVPHYEAIQRVVCLTQTELERQIAGGKISDGFTLSAYTLYQTSKARFYSRIRT